MLFLLLYPPLMGTVTPPSSSTTGIAAIQIAVLTACR